MAERVSVGIPLGIDRLVIKLIVVDHVDIIVVPRP